MRLTDPPARALVETAYARETGDAALLYAGMSLADLTRTLPAVPLRRPPPKSAT